MIDIKQPLRQAYYDLLNGVLTYNGNAVPVVDDVKKLADLATIWVLLNNQAGSDLSTFQTFDSEETIVLDIVFKATTRANKEIVDNIAGQILPLVLPAPGISGLISGPGMQINCVKLKDDRYVPLMLNNSNSVVRRLLTFSQRVRQTGSAGSIPAPFAPLKNPILSSDFTTTMSYLNASLKGRTYQLFLNDSPGFLQYGIQWQYNSAGGFDILIPNFSAALDNVIIYLLLT